MTNSPSRSDKIVTQVYTRCVFFRNSNSTIIEQQVNYFLSFAPLSELRRMETNIIDGEILISLWFDPMPEADNIDLVYSEALNIAKF